MWWHDNNYIEKLDTNCMSLAALISANWAGREKELVGAL